MLRVEPTGVRRLRIDRMTSVRLCLVATASVLGAKGAGSPGSGNGRRKGPAPQTARKNRLPISVYVA